MIYNGIDFDTYLKNYPNAEGYYGPYGGAYISEELKKAMAEIKSFKTIQRACVAESRVRNCLINGPPRAQSKAFCRVFCDV